MARTTKAAPAPAKKAPRRLPHGTPCPPRRSPWPRRRPPPSKRAAPAKKAVPAKKAAAGQEGAGQEGRAAKKAAAATKAAGQEGRPGEEGRAGQGRAEEAGQAVVRRQVPRGPAGEGAARGAGDLHASRPTSLQAEADLARRRARAGRRAVRRGVGRGRHPQHRARARPGPVRPVPASRSTRSTTRSAKFDAGTYGICEISGDRSRGAPRGHPVGARARGVQGRAGSADAERAPSAPVTRTLVRPSVRPGTVVLIAAAAWSIVDQLTKSWAVHTLDDRHRPRGRGRSQFALGAQHRRGVQPRRGAARPGHRPARGHRGGGAGPSEPLAAHAARHRRRGPGRSVARSATCSTGCSARRRLPPGRGRRLHRPPVVAGVQRRRRLRSWSGAIVLGVVAAVAAPTSR